MEERTPVISGIDWIFDNVLPKHFELIYKGRTVATLNLRSIWRYDFEGQFDGIPVRAEYRWRTDRATITNKTNNEVVGFIDSFTVWPSKFTLKDGSVFTLEYKKKVGFALSDQEGNIVGQTNLRFYQKPIIRKFTLYKDDPRLLSPWLVALITFYYALIHSSGSPGA